MSQHPLSSRIHNTVYLAVAAWWQRRFPHDCQVGYFSAETAPYRPTRQIPSFGANAHPSALFGTARLDHITTTSKPNCIQLSIPTLALHCTYLTAISNVPDINSCLQHACCRMLTKRVVIVIHRRMSCIIPLLPAFRSAFTAVTQELLPAALHWYTQPRSQLASTTEMKGFATRWSAATT